MEVIWKFELKVTEQQSIQIPEDSEILTVQLQNGRPFIWVRVDPSKPEYSQTILTYGTGDPSCEDGCKYIGTYQQLGGSLIFHVFKGMM